MPVLSGVYDAGSAAAETKPDPAPYSLLHLRPARRRPRRRRAVRIEPTVGPRVRPRTKPARNAGRPRVLPATNFSGGVLQGVDGPAGARIEQETVAGDFMATHWLVSFALLAATAETGPRGP